MGDLASDDREPVPFVINGAERVIVSQLFVLRYLLWHRIIDKVGKTSVFLYVIPNRGCMAGV